MINLNKPISWAQLAVGSCSQNRTAAQKAINLNVSARSLTIKPFQGPSKKEKICFPSSGSRQQSTSQSRLSVSTAQASILQKRPLYANLESDSVDEHIQDTSKGKFEHLNVVERLKTDECSEHFSERHIGPRDKDIEDMLRIIGFNSLDELIDSTIPYNIRLRRDLDLPKALSEQEMIDELRSIGSQNESLEWKSFIGMGYYDCHVPPAIIRNIFENPGWTTAYTAYQAEVSQGRLESLMNYQTMVSDLTGLDVANASLLDESTAAAEALQVCSRQDKKKRNSWLVSVRCHPQTLAVIETRAEALGIKVNLFDELEYSEGKGDFKNLHLDQYCGVLIQNPNTHGHVMDISELSKACHDSGSLVVVATDLLACALFQPPGEQGADIAVGSSQRIGVPLNFGGPHAGFLACKKSLLRSIPGRVVGITRDGDGNTAYRFALQTREQHIRRDKATSNICTAQALLANMSAMFAVYHGPDGLQKIAESIHKKTNLLSQLIEKFSKDSIQIQNQGSFFDTITIQLSSPDHLASIEERAKMAKMNLRYDLDSNLVGISLDETTKISEVFLLASLFKDGNRSEHNNLLSLDNLKSPVDDKLHKLKRKSKFMQHPTFNTYKSEAQLVRYMKSLENKDISLVNSMIPLGSCTMKLNATSQMAASSWPEFTRCHPFQPVEQTRGYIKLLDDLEGYLCEITGYDKISFQPNSGAQGEYAGLRCIRSYLDSRGESERNVCLIPVSAHGTNPASAQMAGFKIEPVKVKSGDGSIDLEDLTDKISQHRNRLACLMVTYPSTFGIFENDIMRVCDAVHEAGGQVYLDGANMNAQVGLCRPGDYGSDVSHLNLHKTFCIPHGGGGPGAGPIGVKEHLVPFLPSHPLEPIDRKAKDSFGSVAASIWGSPAILPISWGYIRLMSEQLKKASQVAILNANYMAKRLDNDYKILFRGQNGNVAHEFIIDCSEFKKNANVEAGDIAKRLQDFGFHAPTVSWPVSNSLMIEPTESEDKDQLDRYCEALLIIRNEIRAIEEGVIDRTNNPIKNAPHTQQSICKTNWDRPYTREQAAFPAEFIRRHGKVWPTVGRVDDTYGDKNLFCSCPPVN